MPSIAEQLQHLERQKKSLLSRQDKLRANKMFVCLCGHRHKIKECVVIQTHWYTPPRGCTEGDYWNDGELQIICPTSNEKNRVLFDDFDVPWELRREYKYDTTAQFSRLYKHLFKKAVDDYKQDTRYWENNYYFDKNRAKFDLCPQYDKRKDK
jgi:hypothetical protein